MSASLFGKYRKLRTAFAIALFSAVAGVFPQPLSLHADELTPVASGARSSEQRLIRNWRDFGLHMKAHVKRVELLAAETLGRYGPAFGFVPEDFLLVMEFIRLHDQSKINDTPEFVEAFHDPAARKAAGDRSILSRLYEFYATLPESAAVTEEEKSLIQRRKQLIDELNEIDRRVAHDFFKRNGLLDENGRPNEKARRLLSFEKLVDGIDRGEGAKPVTREEFGRELKPHSAFIDEKTPGGFELKKIAMEIESQHREITHGYDYSDYKRLFRTSDCLQGNLKNLFQ